LLALSEGITDFRNKELLFMSRCQDYKSYSHSR